MRKAQAGSKIVKWISAGKLGFHSSKRTTPYAAEFIGKFFRRFLVRRKIRFINIEFSKKISKKMRTFLKGFQSSKIRILRVYYMRKVMFGYIRRPKQRRT